LCQNAIPVVNVMFSVAETIPVFGATLKGAMEALFKVLVLVEVTPSFPAQPNTKCSSKQRYEVSESIAELGRNLASLTDHLSKGPPSEQLARLLW
jgi:hypothetical protein